MLVKFSFCDDIEDWVYNHTDQPEMKPLWSLYEIKSTNQQITVDATR